MSSKLAIYQQRVDSGTAIAPAPASYFPDRTQIERPCAALLSYLTKSPLVPPGMSVTNALFKQRAMLENVFRAVVGLAPVNHMNLDLLMEKNG